MDTIKLLVKAGPHLRRHTPVSIELAMDAQSGRLFCADTGKQVACQVLDDTLYFIVDSLAAGHERAYRFEPSAKPARRRTVMLRHREQDMAIDISINGRMLTSYQFGSAYARPFFHPLYGPQQIEITRNFPMLKLDEETNDHPHHRSMWTAFGDVNGSDNWSENAPFGRQIHRNFDRIVSGPVLGEIQQQLDWVDHEQRKVMHEQRRVRVYATPQSARIMELTVKLIADNGDVRFGDTKEGGLCSVRVATALDGNKGGRIENSAGGVGERECWGKPAHWCDYSGLIDGKHVGIAVFDHPMNLRHPTCWHVRDYGLMSANPFGYAAYQSSHLRDGSYTLPAGEALSFRYRLFIHLHDPSRARLADRFQDYVHPPVVSRF